MQHAVEGAPFVGRHSRSQTTDSEVNLGGSRQGKQSKAALAWSKKHGAKGRKEKGGQGAAERLQKLKTTMKKGIKRQKRGGKGAGTKGR